MVSLFATLFYEMPEDDPTITDSVYDVVVVFEGIRVHLSDSESAYRLTSAFDTAARLLTQRESLDSLRNPATIEPEIQTP